MRWSPEREAHRLHNRTRPPPATTSWSPTPMARTNGKSSSRERARHIHWTRWSADGRHVYFNYGISEQQHRTNRNLPGACRGGVPEPVVATARRAVFPLPSPDGRGLFFAANPDGVQTNTLLAQLQRRSAISGVTFGIGEYGESVYFSRRPPAGRDGERSATVAPAYTGQVPGGGRTRSAHRRLYRRHRPVLVCRRRPSSSSARPEPEIGTSGRPVRICRIR